jgi:DNA modification methylase
MENLKSFKMTNRGINSIVVGDSAKILKQYDKNFFDLVVTSPPYCNLRANSTYAAEFDFPTIAHELGRTLKEGGIIVWNVGDETIKGSETGTPMRQALYFIDNVGLRLHDTMIYAKNSFTFPSRTRYHQIWEYCYIFSKGEPKTFNPLIDRPNKTKRSGGPSGRKKDGTRSNKGGGCKNSEFGMRHNIWTYIVGGNSTTKDKIAYQHPALMPEQLALDMVKSWSNPQDIVLDPFCGAATTLKAAKLLDRNYVGIEISKEYAELGRKRLRQIEKE